MWQIAAIGEVWLNLLPTGVRLGGLPAAAAWYCNEMGAKGILVSAVGKDKHGWRVQRELQQRGVSSEFVALLEGQFTGEVRIHYNENGSPSYHILEDCAWDHLAMTAPLAQVAGQVDGVIFDTLSQRSPDSRRAVYEFLDKTDSHAVRVLALHLRAPYYTEEILEQSFRRATIAKITHSELPFLAKWLNIPGAGAEETAHTLLGKYEGLRFVACTRGENGSLLVDRTHIYDCGGFYADQFVNSYGCAGAFSAVLCLGALNGADLALLNEEANRAACCVCEDAACLVPFSDEVLDNLQKARII